MRSFTKTHFVIVRVVSLIMSILNFIGIAGVVIAAIVLLTSPYSSGVIPGILLIILGTPLTIVIAILMLKTSKLYAKTSQMDDEFLKANKGRILGWGIFFAIAFAPTFIFFVVSLVFVILANNYINKLIDGTAYNENKTFGQTVKQGATSLVTGTREVWQDSKTNAEVHELENMQQSLKKLSEMKELGYLTEEEYQAKRKKILKID